MRTTRTFWHPYTDDTPEALVELIDCDPVAFIRKRVTMVNVSEAGMFRRAYDEKRPLNDPRLGCLVHHPN